MLEKMNKVLDAVGIISIVFFLFNIIITIIGYCINSETVFFAGISFLIFGLPVCGIIWLILFYIVMFLDDKAEKQKKEDDENNTEKLQKLIDKEK